VLIPGGSERSVSFGKAEVETNVDVCSIGRAHAAVDIITRISLVGRDSKVRPARRGAERGWERARGCKDAVAPNARFVSTRATFVRKRSRSHRRRRRRRAVSSPSCAPVGGCRLRWKRAKRGTRDTCFQSSDYPPPPSYTRTSPRSRNVLVDGTLEARRSDLYPA